MDPNKALRQLRRLAEYGRQLERPDVDAGDGYGGYTWRQLAHEQAELVQALDSWLSQGGFPPEAWQGPDQHPEHIHVRPVRDDDYTPAAMDATDPLGPPDPAGVELPS